MNQEFNCIACRLVAQKVASPDYNGLFPGLLEVSADHTCNYCQACYTTGSDYSERDKNLVHVASKECKRLQIKYKNLARFCTDCENPWGTSLEACSCGYEVREAMLEVSTDYEKKNPKHCEKLRKVVNIAGSNIREYRSRGVIKVGPVVCASGNLHLKDGQTIREGKIVDLMPSVQYNPPLEFNTQSFNFGDFAGSIHSMDTSRGMVNQGSNIQVDSALGGIRIGNFSSKGSVQIGHGNTLNKTVVSQQSVKTTQFS